MIFAVALCIQCLRGGGGVVPFFVGKSIVFLEMFVL
jgi:hypothetical protein